MGKSGTIQMRGTVKTRKASDPSTVLSEFPMFVLPNLRPTSAAPASPIKPIAIAAAATLGGKRKTSNVAVSSTQVAPLKRTGAGTGGISSGLIMKPKIFSTRSRTTPDRVLRISIATATAVIGTRTVNAYCFPDISSPTGIRSDSRCRALRHISALMGIPDPPRTSVMWRWRLGIRLRLPRPQPGRPSPPLGRLRD